MSAWIVTKAHIDALVTAGLRNGCISSTMSGSLSNKLDECDRIGAMLWKENHKSVNSRYAEHNRTPPYKFQERAIPLTPVEVFKAIHCLAYQSCEHSGWRKSKAREWLDELADMESRKLPGYNDAPWGID